MGRVGKVTTRHRVVVVGSGKRGVHHAAAFAANPRFELAGLADTDQARLDAAAAKFGSVKSGTDTQKLAQDVKPDVFCFCTPPSVRLPLIELAGTRGVPIMPGCFSPTEILAAWEAGADIVKVFPATALGPTYFRDLRGPMPQVKLMPTGGVTLDNAGDWIRAGAVAVGVGSALLDADAISTGRFEVLTTNAARIVANVRRAREGE